MTNITQSTFEEHRANASGPETKEDSVTKTVVCPMKTSNTKNAILEPAIDIWQEMASHMADLMPSYNEFQWGTKIRKDQRLKRDFPDCKLYAAVRNEAAFKVCESFESWRANGKRGNPPQFGDGDYIRFRADHIEIMRSDKKYGVKAKIRPEDGAREVWWGLRGGQYQREVLDAIVDDETNVQSGTAEIHLHDDGSLILHLNYTITVNVYQKSEIERWIGVDLGEAKMWVCSPTDADGPVGAAVFDQHSAEFRENRERLSRETERLARRGDLNAVEARRQRRNYTDTMTHTAACEIADLAVEYAPCGIALENLTGYRKSAEDPIHDWPYHDLQEKILYKANERGLPVRKVNPAGTSTTCWKCKTGEHAEREGRKWFICDSCGDRRHADANAAINIGMRAANS